MKKKPKITVFERDKIAVWLASKIPLREIARRLDRSVSSISDEIKRNSVDGTYSTHLAQTISTGRNTRCRRLNPRKIDKVYGYVISKLRRGWTPEQISGRLKRKLRLEALLVIGKLILSRVGVTQAEFKPYSKERPDIFRQN